MSEQQPPVAATPGSLGSVGALYQDGGDPTPVPRGRVVSWALWDWATQPFNSVLLTFVFVPLYLTSETFAPTLAPGTPDAEAATDRAIADLASGFGLATTLAGVLILLLAPVLGRSADRSGRRKRWLGVFTVLLALVQFALFFVRADPAYFWYGALAISLGAVVSEIAGVNYNAMLTQVATPKTVGRVSGLGWGLGYLGGIVALVLVVVVTSADWFGLDTSDGLAYRLIAVGCGVWTLLFAIPLFANVPEVPAVGDGPRVGFFASYRELVRDIRRLYGEHRPTFWFLCASAVYRDGLAGVFAFGGILAAAAFGFTDSQLILFAIAANIVAGVSTMIAGRFDDLVGARAVIITALAALLVMALALFALQGLGPVVFWVAGLGLSACVGPAQAASRSLLARVTPTGMQGEIFGLYATTGRVASFLSPALWTLAVWLFGGVVYGVLGLAVVLAVGLVLLLLVRLPPVRRV